MDYHLKLAQFIADLLDNQFQIFKWRFGLDPIIGLIPWVGDIFPIILSLYIVWIAKQYNLPQSKINQMLLNIGVDFLIGVIPIVGDLFDFVFISNAKNLQILKTHLQTQPIIDGEIIAG